MNKKYTLLLTFITGLLLSSCQKDSNIFVADKGEVTGPDTSWYATVTADMPAAKLRSSLLLAPAIDSFEVNNDIASITDASGLELSFPPQCSENSYSQLVNGMVQTETIVLKKKGDFIRMSSPTTSGDKLLISGGAFYIGLKKDGNSLRLSPGTKLTAHFPDTVPSSSMQVFNGEESVSDVTLNWTKNYDLINNYVSAANQSYEIVSNKLNWISWSRPYDMSAVQTTTITTDMPRNFTNFTTVVYVVFNDMHSVVGVYGDVAARAFRSISLPVGQMATVVVISKQGDYYYMGQQQIMTNTPPQATQQVVSINPVRTSLDNVKAYLDTL